MITKPDDLLTNNPVAHTAIAFHDELEDVARAVHFQTFMAYLNYCEHLGGRAAAFARVQVIFCWSDRAAIEWQTLRNISDYRQRARYAAMRLDGTSHRLAEMLALQSPPMSNTDREFLEGRCNGSQFEGSEGVGDYYKGIARAGGVDPVGKVYISGLARYPGDPQAWVSGRGDVRRVCEERGWSSRGAVDVKAPEPRGSTGMTPGEGYLPPAGDIVRERARDLLASHEVEKPEDAIEKATSQLSPAKV